MALSAVACRHAPAPIAPGQLAADCAAAARAAAGTESPIRIVPAGGTPAAPTRVQVTLADASRLNVLEAAWRVAAQKDGVTLESAVADAPAIASYSLGRDGQSLLRLDVFHTEQPSAPAAAAPSPPVAPGTPVLAVILDDLGYDLAASREAIALPGRITVAVLPNLADSAALAEEAHRRGVEVLLHLPMQSLAQENKAEKIELRVGEPAPEVDRVLGEMLATVPNAVGVNNHMGSRATANPALMTALAAALRQRGLFFIDSRTSAVSVALDTVRGAGVAAAARNVFLDDDEQPAAVRRQLARAERVAREHGSCIAIGHPHPATLAVLAEVLPLIERRGVRLVHTSEVVKQ